MIATTTPLLRERFANLDRCTYLINHSMGAAPLAARDELSAYWEDWSADGPAAWERWLPAVDEIADGIGAIIGAPPGSVGLAPNVSSLQETLASALDWSGERNGVLFEQLQFPSLQYVWDAWRRRGARPVRVASDDGHTIPTSRILDAIDRRTRVVLLSHAYFQSGALVDVAAVAARAHEAGALLIVDVYQTAGVLPLDVVALDIDVAVGGSHKWLCGGPGCGYLYVRPELRETLHPTATGWMAHAEPFAFEPPPMRYASGMKRYGNGTPPMPSYLQARAGHRLIREVGVETIRAHNLALTAQILSEADERRIKTPTPRDASQRTGWIGLDVPDGARLVRELERRRVFVDYRPGCGIRVGPHFYTSSEEIVAFFAALDELR